MLSALKIQHRLLGILADRRSGYHLQFNQKPTQATTIYDGTVIKGGVRFSLSRTLSHITVPNKVMESSWKSIYSKKFSACTKSYSSLTHYPQFPWKRNNLISLFHIRRLEPWKGNYARNFHVLSKISSTIPFRFHLCRSQLNFVHPYYRPIFPNISKLVRAVSLSLTRFHVAPGLLALSIGEAAGAQTAWAEGEYFKTRNEVYTKAQDGYAYLSSVLRSIWEGFVLIFRTVYLTILFSPAIASAPFANSFGPQFRKTWLHLVHSTLEKAGPAFIKWGQWAATRPDLFPSDLCRELAKLHSKAPAHSFAYSKNAIEKAFGRKLSEIFEHFEETPVASGSIAQVHRASLRYRYPNQKLKKPIVVAVKVRHPGVGDSIRRDFAIINVVSKVSSFVPGLHWLRLDESVRQFAVFMMSQVDLAREAAHLSRFIYNFRRWKDVSFPKPLYPLVHPSVLVETFELGDSISRYVDDLEGNTRVKRDLAHIGTHALLKMLLVDNFVHADMHPGNILVREPQKRHSAKKLFRAKPHVIFLDVGMTAELSKSDRVNLLEFFKAVAVRDGRTAAECTLKLAKRQSCPNPKAFIEELDRSFSYWGTPEGDLVHPADCMHQLLDTVRRHKVNIDGNVCTVMVTILVLEGWQRKLDPDYDIMHTLKTLLLNQEWAQPIDYFFS